MTDPAATAGLLGRVLPPLLVVAGAPLLIWWTRRRSPGRPRSGLRVTARTALTKGSVLAVVEIDSQRLLIGATDGGINLLSTLPTEGTTDTDEPATSPVVVPGPWTSPIEHLRNLTVRTSPRPRPPRVRST